jgi:hypothetical protein
MARIVSESGPYRVETAVRVWRQLEDLPLDAVRRIQKRLESLAGHVASEPKPSHEVRPSPLSLYFLIDDWAIVCDVSHNRRTITLLDVARQLPEAK